MNVIITIPMNDPDELAFGLVDKELLELTGMVPFTLSAPTSKIEYLTQADYFLDFWRDSPIKFRKSTPVEIAKYRVENEV